MEVSVVIPTYNNIDNLKLCLSALSGQRYPQSDFEIIVIDDGSKDEIKRDACAYIRKINPNIKFIDSVHSGPAAARNMGIKASQGNVVLFIGDDIIVTENFISEHARIHNQYSGAACLGLPSPASTEGSTFTGPDTNA